MHKKMIILSRDAMVWEDLDYLGQMPTLIATSPSFKPGAVVQRRPIVAVAPTLALALGLELLDADGQPVKELLREDLT